VVARSVGSGHRHRRRLKPARRKTALWILAVLTSLAVAILAGLVMGLFVVKRVQSGEWQMPEVGEIVPDLAVPTAPPRPPRAIVLEQGPVTLYPGPDDAPTGMSGIIFAHHPTGPVTLPGWKGSKSGWKKLVTCVKKLFAPFDVAILERRPEGDDEYVLVAVGGKPADIGLDDKHVSGLAPFNGGVIPRPVVLAFAAAVKHDVRTTCETIGMEVAHAYGLDHGYWCKDVMTYLSGCGAKSFVDKDVPCGEKKKRVCKGGAPTQNSYRHLMTILGPRQPVQ